MAEQVGFNDVYVSWSTTAIPSQGYRITAEPGGVSITARFPTQITLQQPGVYNIRVMSQSLHYPGGTAGPVELTLRGKDDPIICRISCYNTALVGFLPPVITTSSVTATTVTVSLAQPPFSFTPVNYTVTLTRVTGSGQALCNSTQHSRTMAVPPTNNFTSVMFTDLQEFSTYTIAADARFREFRLNPTRASTATFATISAGMDSS